MTLTTEIDQLSPEELKKYVCKTGLIFDYQALARSLPDSSPLLSFISTLVQTQGVHDSLSEHYAAQAEMNDGESQLYQVGFFLGLVAQKQFPREFAKDKPVFVIGVLRSGWAIAKGIADAVGGVSLTSTYDEATHTNQKLVPEAAQQPGATLVVADDLLYLASAVKQAEIEVARMSDFDLLYIIGVVNLEYAFFAAQHPVVTLSSFAAN